MYTRNDKGNYEVNVQGTVIEFNGEFNTEPIENYKSMLNPDDTHDYERVVHPAGWKFEGKCVTSGWGRVKVVGISDRCDGVLNRIAFKQGKDTLVPDDSLDFESINMLKRDFRIK